MANVSLIDGHIDNAEHCVCCGAVIPEGRQHCVICGYKADNGKQRQIDRIRNMSVEELVDLIDVITGVCTDHFAKGCHGCPIFEKTRHGFCDTQIIKQFLESEVTE